jgi:hypothetical protein
MWMMTWRALCVRPYDMEAEVVAARASSAGGGGGGRRARGHSNRGGGGGGGGGSDTEDAAKESAELKQMLTEEVGGRVCHVDDFSAQPEPICH